MFRYISCVSSTCQRKYTHQRSDVHTISLDSLCSSLTINIMSKRERMVGMKSMFSSPLVSSQRPYTLLAAARTEHLEFRVVVIPAYKTQHLQLYIIYSLQSAAKKLFTSYVNLGQNPLLVLKRGSSDETRNSSKSKVLCHQNIS